MLHPFAREQQIRRPAVYRTVAHVTFFFKKRNGESVRFDSSFSFCMSRLRLLLSVITIVVFRMNRSTIHHNEVVKRQSLFDLL